MLSTMPRPQSENTFQVAFKIPETWLAIADEVATAQSRPGITITRTDALRAALWRGLNELRAEHEAEEELTDTTLEREHEDVLQILSDGEPHDRDDVAQGMNSYGWDGRWRGLNRTLRQLKESGFIVKRGLKYRSTPKGLAAREWPTPKKVSE